jgi:drug/metabolite transporter (DMT)-like permease
MLPLVFVVFSTVFGISGQLLLKRGMNQTPPDRSIFVYMATSPWVLGGLVVYGLGVLNWLMALARLELSYVYPFASLSYVGIILGSYFLFKEHISRLRFLGIIIIIVGVLITSQS